MIGDKIKDLRIARGLVQYDVAMAIGERESSISRWENGKSIPELPKAKKLADFFGVTIDDLLAEPITK